MTITTPRFRLPAVFLAVAAMIAALVVAIQPAAEASHYVLVAQNASQEECASGGSGNGTIQVPIEVRNPFTREQVPNLEGDITVKFDTVAAPGPGGNAASPGADYVSKTGTVTIPTGSDEGAASVTLVCDSDDSASEVEGEQFTVYFYEPDGASFDSEDDQSGIATIENGAPPAGPHFIIEDATPLPAMEDDTAQVQFTIRLFNTSNGGSVMVEAQDDSATEADDYTVPVSEQPQPRVKAFEPGQNEQTFTVEIDDDDDAEELETFQAVLSNPAGPGNPTIARGTATAVIVDDDAPRVSVNDDVESEGTAASNDYRVPFTVEVAITDPITVEWHTVDGSASSPDDFTATTDTTTIPAGSTTASGRVPISDDSELEDWEENFYVIIDCVRVGGSACGESDEARAGDTFGQMAIQDDEPKINVGDGSAVEGEKMTFTVTLEQFRSDQDISVRFATKDGTAKSGEDYKAKSGTLTWDEEDRDANEKSKTVTVETLQDGAAEGNHAFTLELSEPSFAGIGDGSGEGLISDDDDFTVNAGSAKSGESAAQVSFTGEASGGTPPYTFTWDFGDGSDKTSTTNSTVKHRFAETGTFTVTLKVEDSTGATATDTTTATITDSGQVNRSFGLERISTGIDVSSDHWNQADTVLIATAYNYPDALAAGPLSHKLDAPLLLTGTGDDVPDNVKAELDRLDASKVIILGGAQAVSQAQADELAASGYQVQRIADVSRFGTAANIAVEVGPTANNEVTVALGAHPDPNQTIWADSLSAGSFASLADPLPALLTHSDFVPQETLDALEQLDTDKVFLLGGTKAISPTVEAQLEAEGYTVQRVAGQNRFETSVEAGKIAMGRYPAGQVHPVFATGSDFPDGLTSGALAGKVTGPVVLVVPDDLNNIPGTRQFLRNDANRFDVGTVVGGDKVVSENVRTQARSDIDTF